MSDPLAVLPHDAVLVHIGPHKTGTTSIQTTLAHSRALLGEYGVTFPGRGTGHHVEAKALRQYQQKAAGPPPSPAQWTRFAERVNEMPGRVVISSEFFAQADEAARKQLVRDLDPDRVHILAAARNPAGVAVSVWQQVVRTYGRPMSLETWLEKNFRRTEVPEQPQGFWSHADPGALITQWTNAIPPERISVVVIDERDRRLLPTTFERLLGLPEGSLADQRPPQTNRGLSAVEAALIRQVAESLGGGLSWAEYTRTMRKGVIRRLQEVRQPGADEPKPTLPAWALEQAVVEGERSITTLRDSGVRIIGDLESLRSVPSPAGESAPITAVPIELAAEAVVGAIAVATRESWSLDAPAGRRKAQRGTPRQRKAEQPPAAAASRTEAVPSGATVPVLARRLRGGLRRRVRRLRTRRTPD